MQWYLISDIFVTGYTGGIIAGVKEDNVELSKKEAVPDMIEGSFFHDQQNQYVYIWPSGSDNPNSNGKTYIIYSWIGFSTQPVILPMQGGPEFPYIPAMNISEVSPYSTQLQELFSGNIVFQFGAIKINDPVFGYENINNYTWINSLIVIKYGISGDTAYSEYTPIVWGSISKVSWNDGGINIAIVDIRQRLFSEIPPDRFLKGTFPYLAPEIQYNARPVLVGAKLGISPNLVDTVNHVYEISQTDFDFHQFPIAEISAVYRDGVPLTLSSEYTEDLAGGKFALKFSPGDSVITCDAKGLVISRDFTADSWTNNFSDNIADITYFFLRIQGIEDSYIDEESFEELQSFRAGVHCGDWVASEISFVEKLKELQITGRFHLLPTQDGKVEVVNFSTSAAPEIELFNHDFSDFTISRDSGNIFNRVLVRWDKKPEVNSSETDGGESLSDYRYFRRVQPGTKSIFQTERMKNFKSIINNEPDAESLASELISYFSRPTETISFGMDHRAISWGILDKISITKSYFVNGTERAVYSGQPFAVMKIGINWNGRIQVIARRDPATISGLAWTDQNNEIITDQFQEALTT